MASAAPYVWHAGEITTPLPEVVMRMPVTAFVRVRVRVRVRLGKPNPGRARHIIVADGRTAKLQIPEARWAVQLGRVVLLLLPLRTPWRSEHGAREGLHTAHGKAASLYSIGYAVRSILNGMRPASIKKAGGQISAHTMGGSTHTDATTLHPYSPEWLQ